MDETFQDRVRRRMEQLGKSSRGVSVAITGKPDVVRKLLEREGGTARGETLSGLARELQTTEAWLLRGEGEPEASPETAQPPQLATVDPRAALNLDALRSSMPQDVPVMGTMAGSFIANARVQSFEIESRVIEYVRRPPALQTVPDAYALYVVGDSMAPLHEDGELRFIHPHKPPRIGDSVVIQAAYSKDRAFEAYLGRLTRRSPSKTTLTKLNPLAEVDFPTEFVRSIHRVLTMNELFGV